MKKIIALGGSNSEKSINKRLAVYTANKIENSEVIVFDLNDFDLPLYGIDFENENGIPKDAQRLIDTVTSSDGVVLSLAEHNGSYSAAFKNAMDWMSRINPKLWGEKPMLLMATSPGGRGGQTVLNFAASSFPHLGANVIATFSLPSFNDNFSENGIKDEELNNTLNEKIALFQSAL
ncbi:MAG: NAD(P)H-dependent oxidoreductase [Fluviicola sp.]|nr:NAD(P)H-dependent oxidoreductase [Fluviicola sp.]